MKKCPVCQSSRYIEFRGTKFCKKCGYKNEQRKENITN